MKRPGKPKQRTTSFQSLYWDKGQQGIRLKGFNDTLREIYTPEILASVLPSFSIFDRLLKESK